MHCAFVIGDYIQCTCERERVRVSRRACIFTRHNRRDTSEKNKKVKCRQQESNLRTPSGRDLESPSFGHSDMSAGENDGQQKEENRRPRYSIGVDVYILVCISINGIHFDEQR